MLSGSMTQARAEIAWACQSAKRLPEGKIITGREPSISRGAHGKNLPEYNCLNRAYCFFPNRVSDAG
jgi:hypothetical protein